MNKIKILKASSYYKRFVEDFYSNDDTLSNKTYTEQYLIMQNNHFTWSDVWKNVFEETGKYEVKEIITNNESLQKKWAEENRIEYDNQNWIQDILEAQILKFQPNIFFAHDYDNITPCFTKNIKKKCQSIKLTIGWDGILMNDSERFSECDLILSCVQSVCEFYKKKGFKSYYMHFFFDDRILPKLKNENKHIDFSFVGSLSTWNGLHNERFKTIKKLSCKTPLKIWSPDEPEHGKIYKYPQRQRLLKGKISEFWKVYKLGQSWQGTAFGMEMYQILFNSKITFNSHGDNADKIAANIRLWEATGVGTCLITDWKENLEDFFEIDKEVVTYKSVDECIEKVKFLLGNESVRKSIAEAGQKRTLRDHSANKVLNTFEKYLTNNFSF